MGNCARMRHQRRKAPNFVVLWKSAANVCKLSPVLKQRRAQWFVIQLSQQQKKSSQEQNNSNERRAAKNKTTKEEQPRTKQQQRKKSSQEQQQQQKEQLQQLEQETAGMEKRHLYSPAATALRDPLEGYRQQALQQQHSSNQSALHDRDSPLSAFSEDTIVSDAELPRTRPPLATPEAPKVWQQ